MQLVFEKVHFYQMLDPTRNVVVQEFYAKKGPFTKQTATEGFSTVFGQLMSPL